MRTDVSILRRLASGALVAVLIAAAPAYAQDETADEHGHSGTTKEIGLYDLTPEQRVTAKDAWDHVVCACPKENWSRTLSNCPDGCADQQKQQILEQVLQGWTRDAIVAEQRKLYGPKAVSDPGIAVNGTLLVFAGLVLGAGAAGMVLSQWRRRAAERHVVTEAERATAPVGDAEADLVERELREIE